MKRGLASQRKRQKTICPCCGFKFEGFLSGGCAACGALPVGEALPKPEHELPSYARSFVIAVMGGLMVLLFLTQTIVALVQRAPTVAPNLALSSVLSFDLWSWIAAAETAAWRLKWVAIPVTILVLWTSRKVYRSMLQAPSRFCGFNYARSGLMASVIVPTLIAVLIGVTVPERLRRREWGIEAGIYARGYRIDRALLEYQARNGTLPADPWDLLDKDRLPDPDGSIAEALKGIDLSAYKTSADLAALPPQKTRTLRGAVIRRALANTATDDASPEGLSFNTYELPLPGADGLRGTEDDLLMRDGLIMRASEVMRKASSRTTSTAKVKP